MAGNTARTAAGLCGVLRKTAALSLRLREITAREPEAESEAMFGGEIEMVTGESYSGGQRKGKRSSRAYSYLSADGTRRGAAGRGGAGRGGAGKSLIFKLLKPGGKVYTKIIPDAKSATLIPIPERKVVPDSIVYMDCWRGYNRLAVPDFHHFRSRPSRWCNFLDDLRS